MTARLSPTPIMRRLASAILMLAALLAPAAAQVFPSKEIRLVYPFTAGSGSDSVWRLVSEKAGAILGQTVIYENKPGASGFIGFRTVVGSAPDGYTVGVASGAGLVTRPLANPNDFVAPDKDYAPVIFGVDTYQALVIRAALPYDDLPGLIAYARANPGAVKFAHSGIGTASHLAVELLVRSANIKVIQVPYNGASAVTTSLLSNSVDAFFAPAAVLEHVTSGALLAIATTGSERWSKFPDAPTLIESGVASQGISAWTALIAPPGTPPEVVDKIGTAFAQAMQAPEVAALTDTLGSTVRILKPTEFKELINSELEFWRPIVTSAQIKF